MSTTPQASVTQQTSPPSPPDPKTPSSKPPSPDDDETAFKCTCGTPEASDDWIWCDSGTCAVGWYHMVCVLVSEAPDGKWLCPECRPAPAPRTSGNKSNKKKVVGRGTPTPTTTKKNGRRTRSRVLLWPKVGKTVTGGGGRKSMDSADGGQDKKDENVKDKDKENEKKDRPMKKGVAIKKATPKKKASYNWVEVAPENDGENEAEDADGKGYKDTDTDKQNGDKDDDAAAAAAAQRRRTMRSMVRATQPRGRKEDVKKDGKKAEEIAWEDLR